MTVDIFYFTLFVYSINAAGLDRIITTNSGASQLCGNEKWRKIRRRNAICYILTMFRSACNK